MNGDSESHNANAQAERKPRPAGATGGGAAGSDAELVARIAAGDSGAPVGELYDRYAKRVYGLGISLLRDRGMAEEMVQETFVRLWRSAGRYDADRGSVPTFLFTIARRVAIDLLRRASARPLPAVDPAPEGELERLAGASEGAYDRLLLSLDLQEAVASLSGDHAEVIRLAYQDGLTQGEIASSLRLPIGTVKSRTYHALRGLRAFLEEREGLA